LIKRDIDIAVSISYGINKATTKTAGLKKLTGLLKYPNNFLNSISSLFIPNIIIEARRKGKVYSNIEMLCMSQNVNKTKNLIEESKKKSIFSQNLDLVLVNLAISPSKESKKPANKRKIINK